MIKFKYKFSDVFFLCFFLMFLLMCAINLPKSVWIYYSTRTALFGLGIIGIWRYSWWTVHIVRSLIYAQWVFPKRRMKANQLWQSGWRPRQLFFMMTTFDELPETTEKVLQTIIDECREVNVPAKLFIGIGHEADAKVIQHFFAKSQSTIALEVILIRQTRPGKRFAIGETLREMLQHDLQKDDPVIFMDGDTYFELGCLRLCLPFFHLYPKLQALTTYEEGVVLNGPEWMKKWLEMRFAQRDFTMKSYSLSDKVLTLTGRMSIFRAQHILEPGFIEIVEEDSLDHWLWGKFRFLSGDDKSTWYYLLKNQAQMFYIPDATTVTIENVKGNPYERMFENIRRWSGNTLRNGARAIALGPKRVGFFIWWCLIDQRLSVWTLFMGHTIALMIALTQSFAFLWVTLLWIAFSRLCISVALFFHTRRIDMWYPLLIYLNQLSSSIIKIYILFRLPQQKWQNRGDQQVGFKKDAKLRFRQWMANYLTFFYCSVVVLCAMFYLKIVSFPTWVDVIEIFQ